MAKKPKIPDFAKYRGETEKPKEPEKLKKEQSAEKGKAADMARRPMKQGKLTKGTRRRVP